jgi:hypothetical protein
VVCNGIDAGAAGFFGFCDLDQKAAAAWVRGLYAAKTEGSKTERVKNRRVRDGSAPTS